MRFAYGGLEGLNEEECSFEDLLEGTQHSGGVTDGGDGSLRGSTGEGEGGEGGVVDDSLDWLNDPLGASDAAWERLGLKGYDGEWDDVSDSESTGSWGFMRFGLDGPGSVGTESGTSQASGEERNQWEHISYVVSSFSNSLFYRSPITNWL